MSDVTAWLATHFLQSAMASGSRNLTKRSGLSSRSFRNPSNNSLRKVDTLALADLQEMIMDAIAPGRAAGNGLTMGCKTRFARAIDSLYTASYLYFSFINPISLETAI